MLDNKYFLIGTDQTQFRIFPKSTQQHILGSMSENNLFFFNNVIFLYHCYLHIHLGSGTNVGSLKKNCINHLSFHLSCNLILFSLVLDHPTEKDRLPFKEIPVYCILMEPRIQNPYCLYSTEVILLDYVIPNIS